MIRIGVVNIDVSHPKAFNKILSNENRARYVAIYNDGFRGDDEVEAFVKKYNLERRCKSVKELAEYVDIGFIQGCNWDKHLEYAIPFIKSGKPVFIDKPVVGSLADCRKLEKFASNGAVILGSSSVRYAEEICRFNAMPDEEKGEILNIYGTAGADEFNYAIHIVEAIGGIAGQEAVSSKYVGNSEAGGIRCETFFIRYNDGMTAVYNTCQGTHQPFEVVVMTTKSTFQFRIDTGKIYKALLDRVCDYMETGKNNLATVPKLTESIKIMLAARISRERKGEEIKICDIPADDPGYDGNVFEREYSQKAKKIYLD